VRVCVTWLYIKTEAAYCGLACGCFAHSGTGQVQHCTLLASPASPATPRRMDNKLMLLSLLRFQSALKCGFKTSLSRIHLQSTHIFDKVKIHLPPQFELTHLLIREANPYAVL
jgi:hypothetical protein